MSRVAKMPINVPNGVQVTLAADKVAFAKATRLLHHETNPLNGRRLVQRHGERLLVVNPPALALDERAMDRIYDLPYTRAAHPRYTEPIPAHTMIKDSVTTMRGCFGGCTFCSITMHQGRAIQSRSQASVVREVEQMASDPSWKGHVSDVGGPTANMYKMRCKDERIEGACRRLSCVHPGVCENLVTDHGPLLSLMRAVRNERGVKRVFIASGVRYDLAERSPEFVRELALHHTGGQLSVAPEHNDPRVLDKMKKPGIESYERFAQAFCRASEEAGKERLAAGASVASGGR